MQRMLFFLVALALLLCFPLSLQAVTTYSGFVKFADGRVTVTRGDRILEANEGFELQVGDLIQTGRDSSAGLIFSDDTLISMGPQTEIAVEAYLFDPVEGRLSFVTRILQGTLSYLSGQIAKLAPESVQLIMPSATIGVRGTHVLISVND
jgi:hypothetical protein